MSNAMIWISRRPFVCLFLIAFVVVVSFVFHDESKRRTPFWDKYAQIRLGTDQEEVEAILGLPTMEDSPFGLGSGCLIWIQGEERIFVSTIPYPANDGSAKNRVTKKGFLPKSLWEKLLDPSIASFYTAN